MSALADSWTNSQLGNCGVAGCWGTDSQGRKTLNGQLYVPNLPNEVSTQKTQGVTMKLTCNDGTVSMGDFSNPLGGRVDMPCSKNGGVKSFEKIEDKQPIYYILVTAGVLVAGYFAYKKFKK